VPKEVRVLLEAFPVSYHLRLHMYVVFGPLLLLNPFSFTDEAASFVFVPEGDAGLIVVFDLLFKYHK